MRRLWLFWLGLFPSLVFAQVPLYQPPRLMDPSLLFQPSLRWETVLGATQSRTLLYQTHLGEHNWQQGQDDLLRFQSHSFIAQEDYWGERESLEFVKIETKDNHGFWLSLHDQSKTEPGMQPRLMLWWGPVPIGLLLEKPAPR